MGKRTRKVVYVPFAHPANPARVIAENERRRSSAASPHLAEWDKPRSTQTRKALLAERESHGGSRSWLLAAAQ